MGTRAAAFVLLAIGCGEPVTQFVVVVDTDLRQGTEIDAFRVRVLDPGGREKKDERYDIPEDASLPATFGVRPRDGDASRRVTIEATAILGSSELFSTRAVTSFTSDRATRLDLFLAARCREERCAPDETCRREGCVPAEIDPTTLPLWSGLDASVDAPDAAVGADASAALDAAVDAGQEVRDLAWLARGANVDVQSVSVTTAGVLVVGNCQTPCALGDGAAGPPDPVWIVWIARLLEDGSLEGVEALPSGGADLVASGASADLDTLWVVGHLSAGGTVCDEAPPAVDGAPFVAAIDLDDGTCRDAWFVADVPNVQVSAVTGADLGPFVVGYSPVSFQAPGAAIESTARLEPFGLGLDVDGDDSDNPWCLFDGVGSESAETNARDVADDGADTFFLTGLHLSGDYTFPSDGPGGGYALHDPDLAFLVVGRFGPPLAIDRPSSMSMTNGIASPPRLAVQAPDAIYWTVGTAGDVDVGAGPVPGHGDSDVSIALVGGALIQLEVLGTGAREVPTDACLLGERLVVSGSVLGASDLDGRPVGRDGATEAFVLVTDADLVVEDAWSFGQSGLVQADAVGCDPEGPTVWVAGISDGDLEIDDDALLIDAYAKGAYLTRVLLP